MPLGEFTKQIAKEALKAPVKDVLDSLRPPDVAQAAEAAKASRVPASSGENVGAVILGQIQAMQKAVKEDEELVILFHNRLETIRVLEVYVPSWGVAVLTGIDTERNLTRIISAAENLELTCKVMKVQPGAKAVKVNLIAPKPPGT
jgi:hypothetical protein